MDAYQLERFDLKCQTPHVVCSECGARYLTSERKDRGGQRWITCYACNRRVRGIEGGSLASTSEPMGRTG